MEKNRKQEEERLSAYTLPFPIKEIVEKMELHCIQDNEEASCKGL